MMKIFPLFFFFLNLLMPCANAHAATHELSSRALTLSDMGLTDAVTLGDRNSEQHFYLPLPQDVRLTSARFEMVATYLQPFAGNGVLTVSVNGKPVLTRALKSSITPVELVLPLVAIKPKEGVLDIGVMLSTQTDASHCYDQRGKGIELSLDTRKTRLVYAFENGEIGDIQSLLATLPHRPVILLPGNELSLPQYEAVLRLLRALSVAGMQPELLAVPKVGESVAVDGLTTNAAMSSALRQSVQTEGHFVIRSKQDIAAWLQARMESSNGLAQIVFEPAETRRALLEAVAGDAARLPGWLGTPAKWLRQDAKSDNNIQLMQLAGYPVLGIGSADASNAVKLIATDWKRIANSPALGVAAAVDTGKTKEDKSVLHFAKDFPLQMLTGDGEWQVPLALDSLPQGRWPDAFELNMMASPSSDGKSPVVSVLLNDNLLTASLLNTNGQMTRITARIPLYALRARNTLKVKVSHRLESGLCSGVYQSLPVQLLPSSTLSLTSAPDASQFFMLGSALANHSDIVVPQRYLQSAVQTLPGVSGFLAGMSIGADSFVVRASTEKSFVPKEGFIAFETEPDGVSELVSTRSGHLIVRNAKGKAVFDSTGMGELAVMQLVHSHRQSGIYVTPVTGKMPEFKKPLEIAVGSLAIADAQGVRLVVDMDDPDGALELDEQNRGVKLFFHHYRVWIIVFCVLMLPVLAVLGLRLYYRRRNLQA